MESYSKFWTNVMSTRVMVVGEETEDLRHSGEMVSEARTSYYNYRPGHHSDLAQNYSDFISISQDHRPTDDDGDEDDHEDYDDGDGIIDKKQIRDLADPNMKDDNQVRTVIRYFSYCIMT